MRTPLRPLKQARVSDTAMSGFATSAPGVGRTAVGYAKSAKGPEHKMASHGGGIPKMGAQPLHRGHAKLGPTSKKKGSK